MSFFAKWVKGTKDYAKSGLGQLEAQLIITGFILFGLFAGSVERKVSGDGVIAFILFTFGCLQVFGFKALLRSYRQSKRVSKLERVKL